MEVYKWRTHLLWLFSPFIFFNIVLLFAMVTFYPLIQQEFSLSSTGLQWLLMSLFIPKTVGVLFWGRVGDDLGHMNVLFGGLLLSLVASVLLAFPLSLGWTVCAFIFLGVGMGALYVLCVPVVLICTPPDKKKHIIAIIATIGASGVAVGPLIAGVLGSYLSWHLLFAINALIMFFTALVLLPIVRRVVTPRDHRSRDHLGALLFILFVVSLSLALIEVQNMGWGAFYTYLFFGIAVLTLFLTIAWERVARHPLIHFDVMNSMVAASTLFVTMCFRALTYSFFFIWSIYFQSPYLFGYNAFYAALALLPYAVAPMIGTLPSGMIAHRIGFRIPLLFSLLLITGATLWLFFLPPQAHYGMLWIPFFFVGFAYGLGRSCAEISFLHTIPDRHTGQANALKTTLANLSTLIALVLTPLLFTSFVDHYFGNGKLDAKQLFIFKAMPVDLTHMQEIALGLNYGMRSLMLVFSSLFFINFILSLFFYKHAIAD